MGYVDAIFMDYLTNCLQYFATGLKGN